MIVATQQPPTLILHPLNCTAQWRVRTLRNEGNPIPRWVWASKAAKAPVGILTIDWGVSHVYNRKLKLATLRCERDDLLPPLRDVTIIRMLHGDLTIAGFETITDRDYAQSWFCRNFSGYSSAYLADGREPALFAVRTIATHCRRQQRRIIKAHKDREETETYKRK